MKPTEALAVIKWEVPPPTVHGRGRKEGNPRSSILDQLAAELRANPNRWAVVFEGNQVRAGSVRSSIAGGLVPACTPTGAFQACVRTSEQGQTRVYARFVDLAAGGDSDG